MDSSLEKQKYLQSLDEQSFIKYKPNQSLKDELSPEKAEKIFKIYNRERQYMASKRR